MTTSSPPVQLVVRILDRDYRLACDPGERDALLAAAAQVDSRMRDIRENGRVTGVERAAVLAALEIASEALAGKRQSASTAASPAAVPVPSSATDRTVVVDSEMMGRMQAINALLDTALTEQERLF